MFKYTCGLEFYPDFGYDSVTTAGDGTHVSVTLCTFRGGSSHLLLPLDVAHTHTPNGKSPISLDSNTPFGDVVLLSLGFLLVFMGTLPMAYFNLDDNVWVQIGMLFHPLVFCLLAVSAYLLRSR
jgi:hypothetical protein